MYHIVRILVLVLIGNLVKHKYKGLQRVGLLLLNNIPEYSFPVERNPLFQFVRDSNSRKSNSFGRKARKKKQGGETHGGNW